MISRGTAASTSDGLCVPSTLVDAGIIIAALNVRDRYHEAAADLLGSYTGVLLTTWPAIAETCALVPRRRQAQVLEWVRVTAARIVSIDEGVEFMQDYMAKYDDLPCDFADASLVYAAMRTGVREIWTLDSDFLVYRMPDRTRFKVIPGGKS